MQPYGNITGGINTTGPGVRYEVRYPIVFGPEQREMGGKARVAEGDTAAVIPGTLSPLRFPSWGDFITGIPAREARPVCRERGYYDTIMKRTASQKGKTRREIEEK